MLTCRSEGNVRHLTIARAWRRNALTSALARAIVDAVREADGDPAAAAILLDSEGPTFCAGMDLDEALTADAATLGHVHEALFGLRHELNTPLVVAVQGAALGGGLGLVANGHVVVAADTATFGLAEIRVGMWPFLVWPSVAAAVGERRTLALALTARTLSAAEACAAGLVHEVVPAADLTGRAAAVARDLSAASPEAIRRGLAAARDPHRGPLLRLDQLASPDFAEGVRAFREGRPPRWRS